MDKLTSRNQRINEEIGMSKVASVILDISIAFAPLQLPPYVLLEIVDHFEYWHFIARKQKIDLLVQVDRSIKKLNKF